MKIIVFGTGIYYKKRKEEIKNLPNVEVVAFLDNNSDKWGKKEEGTPIVSPVAIHEFTYDVIILMSTYIREMKEQLLMLGVESLKIKYWEDFRNKILYKKIEVLNPKLNTDGLKKKLLIVSRYLNYDGGSLTAFYAFNALRKKGYSVVLAIPGGNLNLINEIMKEGITIAICPSIPYLQEEDLNWIRQFDTVMVNVFPLIKSAYDISQIRPTLWWIHEAKTLYNSIRTCFYEYTEIKKLKSINTYTVSKIADRNFKKHFPKKQTRILNYGIPDMNLNGKIEFSKDSAKTVFAIIGTVYEGKAQDIFIKAIEKMKNKDNAEFWIIGNMADNEYCNSIKESAEQNPSIKIMGMLTREQIYQVFPRIDVVVCPSREDCLPIVMTEAMMFGKICIASDRTGTAEFITEGENGFVVPVEDVSALSKKMEWILENKNQLEQIGKNTRKTYEQYFSMEVFGDNLERALLETEEFWKENKDL